MSKPKGIALSELLAMAGLGAKPARRAKPEYTPPPRGLTYNEARQRAKELHHGS